MYFFGASVICSILSCGRPIHGLIFLFKWVPNEEVVGTVVQDSRLDKIFFAKQVINNACATQAIISILLNCKHPDLHLGPTLGEFKEFTQTFDANMKGLALSNSDTIRGVHNSFARYTAIWNVVIFGFFPLMKTFSLKQTNSLWIWFQIII